MKKKYYQKPDMKTIKLAHQPLLDPTSNMSGGSGAPEMPDVSWEH